MRNAPTPQKVDAKQNTIQKCYMHHTLGLCCELTTYSLHNNEQRRTLTRDGKQQGSTHTPYEVNR